MRGTLAYVPMGRALRSSPGGYVYHALNRSNARAPIFLKDGDYEAFERVMVKSLEHVAGMRLVAYCLMPNHWHLVLWPRRDGELSDFMHWLTLTHTQRWHAHHRDVGSGHLYQGRFKSFPIEADDHYFAVSRYVERNALRAGLVERAEAWHWGSLGRRAGGDAAWRPSLSAGPLPWPAQWLKRVNAAQTEAELEAIRRSVQRGQPFGGDVWVERTAKRLGLTSTLRPVGRPKSTKDGKKKGS
jgi:putative transposase